MNQNSTMVNYQQIIQQNIPVTTELSPQPSQTSQPQPQQSIFSDYSSWSLLISNLIAIVVAVIQQWDFASLFWIYWLQTVFIGLFQVIKILDLREFDTTGINLAGKQMAPNLTTKIISATFFVLHFSIFLFAYLTFIARQIDLTTISASTTILGFIFFINHFFSFLYNRQSDRNNKPRLTRLMSAPYVRIVPMHLAIMLSGIFSSAMFTVVFLAIKTATDLFLHRAEHNPALLDQINGDGFGNPSFGANQLSFVNKPISVKWILVVLLGFVLLLVLAMIGIFIFIAAEASWFQTATPGSY